MSYRVTEKQFLKDVAQHKMTVLLDNGLYRHLRFASTGPHSWNQWFEIITWPGRLAFSGDMGTFVFARLEDMFKFFRGRPSDAKGLYINLSYWAEKLEAVDRCGGDTPGARQWSQQVFEKRVKEHVAEWILEYNLSRKDARELRETVQEDVLRYGDDGEHDARQALNQFKATVGGETFEFQDTWEWDLQEYTGRFIWCCYAIAWAIQQYDASPGRGEGKKPQ